MSIINQETKNWFQIRKKGIMQAIESSKKNIVTKILHTTKTVCTHLLKTIELNMNPNKISTIPYKAPILNLKIQEKKATNKISFISPISRSTPETKLIEMPIIQYAEKSELKPKCNFSKFLENTPKPVPRKLMSLDTKPTHQLEEILNDIEEKSNHNI